MSASYTTTDPRIWLRKYMPESFQLVETNSSSKYIIFPGTSKKKTLIHVQEINSIGRWNLGVFGHFKKGALEIEPDMPRTDKKGNGYNGIFEGERGVFMRKGWEVDIKAAYWTECHNLGIVSDKMFGKFLNGERKKKARNMAIGTSNMTKDNFDLMPFSLGGEKEDIENARTLPFAPKLYRYIVSNVVEMLGEMAANCGKPVFYFVDQLYVDGGINEKLLSNIAKDYGHQIHCQPVFIYEKPGKFIVSSKGKKGKELRNFYMSTGRNKIQL